MINIDLRATWDEFVLTIGMLCTSVTGRPAPCDPAALLEHAREVGVLPTDSLPKLRRASSDFKNLAWLCRPDLATEQARDVLREMYQTSGWATGPIVRRVFDGVGFTTWDAEDVPLEWSERPSGFFAQRGELRLYVSMVLSRIHPPTPTDDIVAWRLVGHAYKTMMQSPGYANALPDLVIVHTATNASEPRMVFVESSRPDVPSRHEFFVRMDQIPHLRGLLTETFR